MSCQSFLFIPGVCFKRLLKAHRVMFWTRPASWSRDCLECQNSLWLLLLKRQTAISLPSICRFYLLQTSQSWGTLGKVEEYVQVCLEEPQVDIKLHWEKQQREAHPLTSSFPKFHWGLNRQKWVWGDEENWWWALFISWSQRQSEWRLLQAAAWLMRAELSDVPYFQGKDCVRLSGGQL